MGRRVGVCTFIVCLQTMMCACGSRAGGVGPPATPPIDRTSPSPIPAPGAPGSSAPSPVAPRAAGAAVDECAVLTAAGPAQTESKSDPIAAVGLTDPIDPRHAPRPTNESERLLFRQLYETLVRADCMGQAVPGLAESWRLDADGRTWLLTLRENARFSDGTPVGPNDVRASWTRDGVDRSLRPEVTRLIEALTATGERTLAIRLRSPRVDMPLSLAHPDLAIARSLAESGPAGPLRGSRPTPWPLGTRSGLIVEGRPSAMTITRDHLEVMRFLAAPRDPRDLLDRGVDLLLTRNPAALDYATALPSFQSTPLAWQRTYVLLTPGRARALPLLSDGQREALADEAVRGDARGAAGPFWWQGVTDCDGSAPSAAGNATPPLPEQRTPPPPTPRIVYDAGDGVARDLAERFVGLVRASGSGATPFLDVLLPDRPRRTYQRATGLTADALAVARRSGRDAGYVIALDRHPIDRCRDLLLLTGDVPWLDPETIVPLVDTRLHAIVRRGRAGATAEWDGGLLIAPGEAARGGATGAR